jgi:hypothetical protein
MEVKVNAFYKCMLLYLGLILLTSDPPWLRMDAMLILKFLYYIMYDIQLKTFLLNHFRKKLTRHKNGTVSGKRLCFILCYNYDYHSHLNLILIYMS